MNIGETVIAYSKMGKYIGEITEVHPNHYVVRILAVLKHPMQGDLHHPRQVNVPLFHERKAKAYREQTNIPLNMVRPYEGDIPDYQTSLKKAFDTLLEQFQTEKTPFHEKCIEAMKSIQREYELMYNMKW